MMKKFAFLTCVMSGMLFFASCSNDDEPTTNGPNNEAVPQAVLNAFQSQYGETRADWSVKDGYAIADFSSGTGTASAWYALDDGAWGMTETEIPYASLPQAIRAAIAESAYADWTPDDDVDVLERNGAEKLYVVEMKSGGVEVDLYFTEEGVLVREEVEKDGNGKDYSDCLPQTPASGLASWIEQHYPQARIVDIDRESNGTEVEIVDNGLKIEIWFDASSAWVQTKTEYTRRNMPDVVRSFVQANYAGYEVDDVDRYETSEGVYYCVELERGDFEKKIYLNEQGEEIGRPSGGDVSVGGSVTVTSGIEAVLNEKYPGAKVKEREYDDGRIEVEIIHDGREKEVLFSMAEEWLRTTYEIRSSELPEAVVAALKERFNTVDIRLDDEAECVETPAGIFYEVEVERPVDADVYISAGGEIQWVEVDD